MKRAFTLIELMLMIAILLLLAAILFPIIGAAKQQGHLSSALSRMKQLGVAVTLYAEGSDGKWVPSTNYDAASASPSRLWTTLVRPFGPSDNIFIAPNTDGRFAARWSDRSKATIGMTSATAYAKSGCEDKGDLTGCKAFRTVASLDGVDQPSATPVFAITPGGAEADRYLGYEFNPYNGVPNLENPKASPPLISDRDLVAELTSFPADLLKPIYARYLADGQGNGRAPLSFADGSAKTFSARQMLSPRSGIQWRFR